MSKLFSWMIGGGLLLAALGLVNLYNTDTSQQADFIQISVLAQSEANYGVDEMQMYIPAVSMEIIEDVLHDAHEGSSVPVIRYTSLPQVVPNTEPSEESESVTEIKHNNGHTNANHGPETHGNSNGNGNENPPGNGNGNGGNNKDKDNEKKDRQDKEKDK